jgi:hypothetical protein
VAPRTRPATNWAVTRALSGLQEAGAIELRKRRVHVRDFDALRRSAGE